MSRLIVSFHDLHPGSRPVCERFLAQLAGLGVTRTSLLVVPRWHGDAPLAENPACVAWLQELAACGHDLCLHGYFHRAERVHGGLLARWVGQCYTQGEGEFFQLDRATAAERIRRGLAMLAGAANLPIAGFTAPAWLLSPAARAALVEAGLEYSTLWSGVDLLQQNRFIAAPTLVYSCRHAWRRTLSRGWVRFWHRRNRAAPILRLAVHPGDFVDRRVVASLFEQIEQALAAGRTPVTYRDLVTAPPGFERQRAAAA